METSLMCPQCGSKVQTWRNPAPTVDVVLYDPEWGVVLVERRQEPFGYALPGGFVEQGETVEQAAVREMLEETSLHIRLTGLLGVYSDPSRDLRRHTMSTVFVAVTDHPETLQGGDDAIAAAFHPLDALPKLAFDHARILEHFKSVLDGTRPVGAVSTPLESVSKAK